uniref:Uncharacterized protein n=1 Tax=Alexandrium monilatum TaxID=311494 RepID=A0A7S4V9M1_9DINO|mmetsp:Transcript_48435/g.144686  ORF Transcript_48435/g.144686 Transcript_48435/m.144686 type:complete len:367 (+) Transcript_48435:72-1172(+)
MSIAINGSNVTITKAVPSSSAGSLPSGAYISPWVDGVKDKSGAWQLPEYPCEIKGLGPEDPRAAPWKPGDYQMGVDNTDVDDNNNVRHWGGQKMWPGDKPPADWERNLRKYPQNVQDVLKVPHMPGQPVKEMFARMKALDPRPFEDKYFGEIHRDLPASWMSMVKRVKYAESYGIHTEEEPAEWQGQEDELTPAAYTTPRPDTVTVSVGVAGYDPLKGAPTVDLEGVEYDYCEFLYAKDQEGKVIQIVPFENCGMNQALFCTFSFVPPLGTTSITPFASFKLRGVWKGLTIAWDESVGSEEMRWFTDMAPEMRLKLADKGKLEGKNKAQVDQVRFPKTKKHEPVLWPENSWEGNAAKARLWDASNQ